MTHPSMGWAMHLALSPPYDPQSATHSAVAGVGSTSGSKSGGPCGRCTATEGEECPAAADSLAYVTLLTPLCGPYSAPQFTGG